MLSITDIPIISKRPWDKENAKWNCVFKLKRAWYTNRIADYYDKTKTCPPSELKNWRYALASCIEQRNKQHVPAYANNWSEAMACVWDRTVYKSR